MKSKFCISVLLFITLLIFLNACKPKQSAYQQVYVAALAKSTIQEEKQAINPLPTTKSKVPVLSSDDRFQTEKIITIDTEDNIKQYNVVIGSFVNKTNAESLKKRMQAQGYNTILAKNEKDMYRVIIATFDNKVNAIEKCKEIKEKFAPEFIDAWLLQQND